MYKLIVILIFVDFIAFSDEECQKNKNLLATNLGNLIPVTNVPFIGIEYHRKIDCNSSIGFEINSAVFPNVEGYRGGIEYRYYPLKSALRKLFISPRFLYSEVLDNETSEEFEAYTIGVAAGWVFQGRHLSLNLGFGLDYNTGPSLQQTELMRGQSNTTPHIKIALGWSW